MSDHNLRPRSASEILDAAIRLLRRHYLTFLVVSAIGYAPQLLIGVAQFAMLDGGDEAAKMEAMSQGAFAFGPVAGLVITAVYMVWWAVTEGVYVSLASRAYHTGSVDVADAFARARRRFPHVLGAAILVGLATVGAGLLLIIPGIYVACRLYTSMAAAVLDDAERGGGVGPFEAVGRTWRRTSDRAGHVFKTLFLAFLIFMIALFGAGMIGGIGLVATGGTITSIGFVLASALLTILTYPLIPIVTTLLYYDLRIRGEGYDLEAQVAGLGADDVGVPGGQLPPAPTRLRVR